MKFLCGGCRTKYQISDDKIRGKVLTIRCKKCDAKILVRESLAKEGGTAIAPIAEEGESPTVAAVTEGRSAVGATGSSTLQSAFDMAMRGEEHADVPTSIAPAPANAEVAGLEWYIALEGDQTGPFAFAELVRKVQAKELGQKHYVWHDGMDGWKRIKDVPDLAPYMAGPEKKKPPPPPPTFAALDPARGAEVVDFASRRKERDQKKTTGEGSGDLALSSGDIEREASAADKVESSLATAAGDVQAKGKGESSSPKPESAADVSFDKDDIFANLPRATEQEVVSKESTRFFIAASGVNRQRSRARMAKLVGGGIGALLLLFMGLWATGVIKIELPVIGKLFEASGDKPEGGELAADDLSNEDAEALKKMLDPAERRKYLLEQAKKRAKLRAAQAAQNPLAGAQVGQGQAPAAGTRGGDDATGIVPIGDSIGIGSAGGLDVPTADLGVKRKDIDLPVVESGTLSHEAIERVINDRKKSVSICYQQSLRGNVELRGRLDFVVSIAPSGLVSKATVETTAFKGTKLARCIASKIKEWRFPAFSGDAVEVSVPFLLEKSSY